MAEITRRECIGAATKAGRMKKPGVAAFGGGAPTVWDKVGRYVELTRT
jgi:hypothetical protein